MTIGERIKFKREELNISQDELARRLGYKSRSSINKIELGLQNLNQSKIKAIADALQTTPSFIMGWTEDKKEPTPENEDGLTENQQHLIDAIRNMSPENAKKLRVIVEQVIDERDFQITPDVYGKPETLTAHLFLLESELYGEDAAGLIVNDEKQIVMEDVWNGFDDLEDAGWEKARKIECPVCKGEFLREDMTFTRDCHGITYRLVCFDCYDKVMGKGYDGEYYTEADECIEEDY